MNRSQLNTIIREEIAALRLEAVPSNIQKFATRKGADAKKLVRQVDTWATKIGKRITGGTAVGKNYSTLILDLTHQGGEIAIDLDEATIEVQGEPVTNFKEFEMAVMNLTNEGTVNQDTVTLKKMNDINHTRLVKWLHNQFADKYAAALKSLDAASTKGNFTMDVSNWDKKDIAVLKKYLKSQDYMFEAIVKEATNKWNESDFPIGAIAHMDDEQWKVVKPGSRNGKIFMMPFNREAKDRHVSIAIEFDLNWLNTEVDTIEK